MTHARSTRKRLTALVTAGLATLLLALAFSAPSASATPFCSGARINNVTPCYGTPRVFRIIQGSGNETAVCVGYNEFMGPCSSGPGAVVQWDLGSYAYRTPWIIGTSARYTIAWGETF